jgi:CheY-like chemotaxis protein
LKPSIPDANPPILVVDPDPAVGTLIERHIEEYDIVRVDDADRLAEKVMLHHPRAVVWNTPPGEVESHHDLPSVPVPFVECSLPSHAWLTHDLAVTACLTKPITGQQLLWQFERLGNIHDVLIIDDERGFCQLAEQMLEASDHTFEVRHGYDGQDGLRAMHARRPDVVLLDLIMPGIDGFQVLEEMRQDADLADVPVILLTATSYVEDALTQRSGQVVIRRPNGLSTAETLRCLHAVIEVLEPRYDEGSVPQEVSVMQGA